MTLSSPALLAVGLVVTAALAAGVFVLGRRRAGALAAAGVTSARPVRQGGAWLSVAGLAVLALAVSDPAASVPVPHAAGTVILAMDVSGSMAAKDVAPNRLAAAQRAARSFIAAQPGSVDIGVVAFEEGGLTTALPSADHSVADGAVGRLRIGGGTSLGSAIVAALAEITKKRITIKPGAALPGIGYWPSATIVMFTDGQDEGGGVSVSSAAMLAAKAGVHVDTVGVGTTAGTEVTADGYQLFTALNPATLSAIAKTTAGRYYPATDAGKLDQVAATINLRLTVANHRVPLAPPFLGLALLLLAIGAVMTVLHTGRVV